MKIVVRDQRPVIRVSRATITGKIVGGIPVTISDTGGGGSSATPVATTSGTAAALTATLGLTALPSVTEAVLAVVTFHTAPDAGATLNPNGLGALPLRTPADAAIGAGAVTPGIALPVLIHSDRVQLVLL